MKALYKHLKKAVFHTIYLLISCLEYYQITHKIIHIIKVLSFNKDLLRLFDYHLLYSPHLITKKIKVFRFTLWIPIIVVN